MAEKEWFAYLSYSLLWGTQFAMQFGTPPGIELSRRERFGIQITCHIKRLSSSELKKGKDATVDVPLSTH